MRVPIGGVVCCQQRTGVLHCRLRLEELQGRQQSNHFLVEHNALIERQGFQLVDALLQRVRGIFW